MEAKRSLVAFLFPGQGSQVVGMGKELAAMYPVAQHTFDEADEALGFKLSQLCFEGPEDQLKLTQNTQPAILTASIAAARVLSEVGVSAEFAAGHSLGEYSAHVAAGTLEFADAVRTVRNRGKYMQEAVPVGQGAMAAILGMELDALKQICDEATGAPSPSGKDAAPEVCEPANINSPGQIVISGSTGAVKRAADLATSRGAKRAVMLPVSAPFHCALMKPAQDRLEQDLRVLKFNDPDFPVIANVDVELKTTANAAREALVKQVTGAVQWEASMRALIAKGIETFVEVGPGKVLSGLLRQIDRTKLCLNVENEESLQRVVANFAQHASAD
jgi:[acyl-carrier-protein] S-malonyltransferase